MRYGACIYMTYIPQKNSLAGYRRISHLINNRDWAEALADQFVKLAASMAIFILSFRFSLIEEPAFLPPNLSADFFFAMQMFSRALSHNDIL